MFSAEYAGMSKHVKAFMCVRIHEEKNTASAKEERIYFAIELLHFVQMEYSKFGVGELLTIPQVIMKPSTQGD